MPGNYVNICHDLCGQVSRSLHERPGQEECKSLCFPHTVGESEELGGKLRPRVTHLFGITSDSVSCRSGCSRPGPCPAVHFALSRASLDGADQPVVQELELWSCGVRMPVQPSLHGLCKPRCALVDAQASQRGCIDLYRPSHVK